MIFYFQKLYNLFILKTIDNIPLFEERLSHLDQFIQELAGGYQKGKIKSWDDLELRVKTFFTPEMMDLTSSVVPHWQKMASYADGITLTHVMCVFMGLYIMPEFLALSKEGQQIMKWVILFHDVEKELQEGKRDYFHAFRSAVGAARTLPKLGFPITTEYDSLIDEWDAYTQSAITKIEEHPDDVQDNRKLPKIIDGIERMFGHNTPTALIIKTILFHLSVPADEIWPPPNPLTNKEIKLYFDMELLPLLKVMNLGDNDGWAIFDPPTWEYQRSDTIKVFEKLERLLSE